MCPSFSQFGSPFFPATIVGFFCHSLSRADKLWMKEEKRGGREREREEEGAVSREGFFSRSEESCPLEKCARARAGAFRGQREQLISSVDSGATVAVSQPRSCGPRHTLCDYLLSFLAACVCGEWRGPSCFWGEIKFNLLRSQQVFLLIPLLLFQLSNKKHKE